MTVYLLCRRIGKLTLLLTLSVLGLSFFGFAANAEAKSSVTKPKLYQSTSFTGGVYWNTGRSGSKRIERYTTCTEITKRWSKTETGRMLDPSPGGWQLTVRYLRTDQTIVRQYRIRSGNCRTNSGLTIRHRVGRLMKRVAIKATFIPSCEADARPNLKGECPEAGQYQTAVAGVPAEIVCREGFTQVSPDLCLGPIDECGNFSWHGPDGVVYSTLIGCYSGDLPPCSEVLGPVPATIRGGAGGSIDCQGPRPGDPGTGVG